MRYDLGYFDDETCRLEPIENPFGPSPCVGSSMSPLRRSMESAEVKVKACVATVVATTTGMLSFR